MSPSMSPAGKIEHPLIAADRGRVEHCVDKFSARLRERGTVCASGLLPAGMLEHPHYLGVEGHRTNRAATMPPAPSADEGRR